MKASLRQVVIIACSLTLLVSCSKINLHGGKGGNAPAAGNANPSQSSGGGLLGGQQQAGANSPPLIDGEWEVDYEFKGTPYQGNVTFAQSGTAVSGAGADQDGKEWQVDNGQVQGTKISFGKKYAGSSSPPVIYTGELKYLQTSDYTGWAMEGSYTAQSPDGAPISGNWVANPISPLQQQQADTAAPPQPTGSLFVGGTPPAQSQRASSTVEHIGDARPVDISGHYDGSYNYNFKKVKSKMWIESDGNKVTGRGYDVVGKASSAKAKGKGKGEKPAAEGDGNEHFTIERGWYDYPNVTLIRQYTKGKGARETRKVIFRAKLSSNGRDIVMKGETQFGGSWDAHRL